MRGLAAWLMLGAALANASLIVVDDPSGVETANSCTLINAIKAAMQNKVVGTCAAGQPSGAAVGDMILFAKPMTISPDATIDIDNSGGPIFIEGNGAVTILGSSPNKFSQSLFTINDLSNATRVSSDGITFHGITIADNFQVGDGAAMVVYAKPIDGSDCSVLPSPVAFIQVNFLYNQTQPTFPGPSVGGFGGALLIHERGHVSDPCPAIATITVRDATFTGNTALRGGAIAVISDPYGVAHVNIETSTFSINQTSTPDPKQLPDAGGAIYTYQSNAWGGGEVVTRISNSTFHQNISSFGASIFAGMDYADLSKMNMVHVDFSTFYLDAPYGTEGPSQHRFMLKTQGGAVIELKNSVLKDMGGLFACSEWWNAGSGSSTFNVFWDQNLFAACPPSGGSQNLTADPLLAALGNNGGPTLTMKPSGNSPAVNTADSVGCQQLHPVADQRSVARPQGGACDRGAVEQ
jgi:hypothetical protein